MSFISNKFPQSSVSDNKKDILILLIIVICNLAVKIIPAAILELGNDEVYYWTYALFPDWSHFDHPPMVGLIIQLFTLNLTFTSEFLIRAGSLILSSADIIILFLLVRRIFSRVVAYISVTMYISSIYFNIISGLFILPDSPQIFFVLAAIYFLLPSVTLKNPAKKDNINIILFGIFTGFALLSKYHSLFLWLGAGLYILFRNRIWLKKPALYISVSLTFILFIPVIYWNLENGFISFAFHGNRLGLFENPLNLSSFLQFNLGELFYQNPVLSVVFLFALIKSFGYREHIISEAGYVMLFLGIPLILVFTFISLFRTALPHWSGPAFICLIIFSSEYLGALYSKNKKHVNLLLSSSVAIFILVLVLGTVQIRTGLIGVVQDSGSGLPGRNDFTLDMYGWKQTREKFTDFLKEQAVSERQLAIISDNWFPAAHLDYYVARPLKIKLLALGNIERIHKYFWINKKRRLGNTDRIFFVTDSRNYQDPDKFRGCFSEITPADTLPIIRSRKIVKYVFIYEMAGLKSDTVLYSPHPGF